MKGYNFPPLGMTIPAMLGAALMVATSFAMLLLPHERFMDVAGVVAPLLILDLVAFMVGFVFAMAKQG